MFVPSFATLVAIDGKKAIKRHVATIGTNLDRLRCFTNSQKDPSRTKSADKANEVATPFVFVETSHVDCNIS